MLLMHKNIPVADVKIIGEKPVSFEYIYNSAELPLGTKGNNSEQDTILLKHWYESRSIPNTRPNIASIEQKLGVTTAGAFLKSSGVSITDTYWLKNKNSDISWEDINYHKNGFSEVFANIENLQQYLFEPSPDFTTDGIMSKFWLSIDGIPYLYKRDTKYQNILTANEVVVSKIASDLGVLVTPYFAGVQTNKNTDESAKYCFCPCFVEDDQTDFVNAMQVKHSNFQLTGDRLLRYFAKDLGFDTQIKEMTTLDCLFHNTDRHERNFGYLQKKNGEKCFVPLFDSSFCLGVNRDFNYLISDYDTKPTCNSRKELLENYGVNLDFDKSYMFRVLLETYSYFDIPEIRYQIAKEELEKGIELLEEFRQKIYNGYNFNNLILEERED